MKKLLLPLMLVSAHALGVINVETVVSHGETQDMKEQIYYVGDHIKRTCGDVEIDGTIRQIYGDDVTVHVKINKGEECLDEQDIIVAWGQQGTVESDHIPGEITFKLTDLYDQHPKKENQTS